MNLVISSKKINMSKLLTISFIGLFLLSCNSQEKRANPTVKDTVNAPKKVSKVDQYYLDHHQDSIISKSKGSTGNGSLEHGTLIPFSGTNYTYFDSSSYISGRAFTNDKVAKSVIQSYHQLKEDGDSRKYQVMEFSNEHGGKMFPHRTHQNGLSVDLMMPLQKNNKPYYGLDSKGLTHYLLDFNTEGEYTEDTSTSIDFDAAAKHLLALEKQARKNGLRITKVIFNTDLKDELYASPNGKLLTKSGIYITRNLTPLINGIHDDHYHVDFGFIH